MRVIVYVDKKQSWIVVRVKVVISHAYYIFFFKQKTAYEMLRSLVGSEMCIRDRLCWCERSD